MSRLNLQILLGALLVLATSVIVLVYGMSEQQRMAEALQAQQGRKIEQGATLFDAQCARCHGPQGKGTPGLCPPLNDRNFFDNRLAAVGWSGTLEDYIVATASSGRLVSTRPQLYPGQGMPAMPAFSDQFGGPLRTDQIRMIAAYIINWKDTATTVEVPPTPSGPTVGTDITKQLPQGDAQHGQALVAQFGCTACHIAAPTGPAWMPTPDQPGIGARAQTRFTQPDYTGKATNAEQYLFEAIVNPSAYLVPNFQDIMPKTFATQLTDQDMADIIAYLLTIK